MARIKGKAQVEKKANALRELKVVYVKPEEISPNDYNPNRQDPRDFELLLKSMREDGFTQPIIVQRSTNQIVDGEHRWKAAKELGLTQIPIVYVDMTPEQMKIATLRHNRARGEEDIELTANVLRDLQELGAIDWAQDSLNLDDAEINKLIEDIPAPDGLMNDEFTQSWEPDPILGTVEADTINEGGSISGKNIGTTDTPNTLSITPKTEETMRERETRIREAKDGEERQTIKREAQLDTYKVTLVFMGDEVSIVKNIIGKDPAAIIVQMCKEKTENITQDEQPET